MPEPPALSVIFRTQSDIEASVVQGLLDTHGIETLLASDIPHSVFPLTIDGLGEVRVSVRAADAERAKRLIDDFRDEVSLTVGKLRDQFTQLEQEIGHDFRDRGLLEHALTHRSHAHEDASGGVVDNESLEFLGDAVLGLIIADRLFHEFPEYDEGRKSKAKASLVSAPSLTTRGEALGLGDHLLLGRGEERSGGRKKPSLIADAFEAVVAAVYLDGGLVAAEGFIERQFREALDELKVGGMVTGLVADHKSALQEWLQGHGEPPPVYVLAGTEGPDHQKVFTVEVRIGERVAASADGRSKKEAEQQAAESVLRQLRDAESAERG